MAQDLWERSSEDVRERWRDIARSMRDTGDAEALPRALQAAFWFGAEASRRASQGRFDSTLRGLLPSDLIVRLQAAPVKGTTPPRRAT